MNKVYIAAPFFNEDQLVLVKHIESACESVGIDYFSPRSFGVLKDMTSEEKKAHMSKIYEKNIEQMIASKLMIAVIDDYDVGTMFEIGYYTRLRSGLCNNRTLITVTGRDYGLNIMLQNSIDIHLQDKEAIAPLLTTYLNEGNLKKFFDSNEFNENVT